MAFPWLAHVLPVESGRAALISFFIEPFLASLEERKKSGENRGDFIDFFLDIQNTEIERKKATGTEVGEFARRFLKLSDSHLWFVPQNSRTSLLLSTCGHSSSLAPNLPRIQRQEL